MADEAGSPVTLYGQEKDSATSGLARMNMILHNNPTALIVQGNTLADPKFKDGAELKTFNYVVANPPFSDKRWSTGLDPASDPHERFASFGTPPDKQGDYAYLLHIVRSLKSTGKLSEAEVKSVVVDDKWMAAWYRNQVRTAALPLLAKWARVLKVEVSAIFVRRMKTKWGSCSPVRATIRLNTELAKKPPACLEYVLVHELAHLIEPTHNDRFRVILGRHLPHWPHLRDELNSAPLAHVDWDY